MVIEVVPLSQTRTEVSRGFCFSSVWLFRDTPSARHPTPARHCPEHPIGGRRRCRQALVAGASATAALQDRARGQGQLATPWQRRWQSRRGRCRRCTWPMRPCTPSSTATLGTRTNNRTHVPETAHRAPLERDRAELAPDLFLVLDRQPDASTRTEPTGGQTGLRAPLVQNEISKYSSAHAKKGPIA